MNNWAFKAFILFGILFIVAAFFLVSTATDVAGEAFPSDAPPGDSTLTAMVALVTAVVSLVGAILTFILSWQQDIRRQKLDQIVLERERVALEKERLALERLRRELEQAPQNPPPPDEAPTLNQPEV
jgi:hypothetical protein